MEATQSEPPGLLVLAVGWIAAAVCCHEPPRPRYGIFTGRIVLPQPWKCRLRVE